MTAPHVRKEAAKNQVSLQEKDKDMAQRKVEVELARIQNTLRPMRAVTVQHLCGS